MIWVKKPLVPINSSIIKIQQSVLTDMEKEVIVML